MVMALTHIECSLHQPWTWGQCFLTSSPGSLIDLMDPKTHIHTPRAGDTGSPRVSVFSWGAQLSVQHSRRLFSLGRPALALSAVASFCSW